MIVTFLVMYLTSLFVQQINRDQTTSRQGFKRVPLLVSKFFLAVVIPNVLFKNKLT